MAKGTPKNGGNSKIRFIMLEADLADGDLTQITQAITTAVRQGQPVARQPAAIAARASAQAAEQGTLEFHEVDDGAAADVEGNGEEPTASKPRGPRRLPTPKVLADVDLNTGDPPFEKFANEKGPKAALSRYLVVAYWFKTHRHVDAVTIHHVYTCYKRMSWGTDIKDFAQPLRDNARQGRGDMKKGAFAINHVGEAVVEKMTPE
ncbi:MAG: hypothetical protein HY615_01780 [Candidatus Rokubacteria bacterium]|nr:hypothetical protein [Candidatus Rokubacteria bacterium]